VVVIAREFLVTAIRGVVEASGRPFPADRLGKWKMVSQCILVGTLMTYVAGADFWAWLGRPIFWVSLVLTVVSGLNYVWKARDILFASASR
jgi:CDP-diacylglycerol--glycerol-3-phosphate 3-phosphatidyltransferase